MPEPLTISASLIPIAEHLVAEGLIRGIEAILGRTPVQKAIRSTADLFNSRCSDLRRALELWVQSENFKREMENVASGMRIPMMSITHSDLMPISSERSDARLSHCEVVIDISQ